MSRQSPPPRQRRLPREETRRRLLAAAADVFASRGYEATSLEEVAAAAGFSTGAVYSNFESKQELLIALMREQIEQRVRLVRDSEVSRGTIAEGAGRAGGELAELLVRQPEWHLLFIEFWVRAVRDQALRAALAEQRRPMRALIAELIEEQAAELDVRLPAPAEHLAVIVLALSNGLAIEHLTDPDDVSPALFATAFELLLGGSALRGG
jgi:AcrR family transcriptional regulator